MPNDRIGSPLQGQSTPAERLYFGCWGSDAGHYLHDDKGRSLHYDYKARRWPVIGTSKIDGSFAPKGDTHHGAAKLWHTNGWTVLAFWDYSRDSRPGSNAAFIYRGTWDAEDLLNDARGVPAFAQQLDPIEQRGPISVVEEHAS